MPSRRAAVTEAEIRRCLKAAHDVGYEQPRLVIEMPGGARVTIEAGKLSDTADTGDDIDAMIKRMP